MLNSGVQAIGRGDDGQPTLVEDPDAAIAQFCIDRRGVWLQVREGTRGLHVNGRPVRRMAMLRAGDAVFVDGIELLVLGAAPLPAPDDDGDTGDGAAGRTLLRGVGGQYHGRSLSIDRPRMVGRRRDCDICIQAPELGERHARLEPHADGVVLRDLGSDAGSIVNGHPVRHALLRPGDQVLFAAQHRFVVESARSTVASLDDDAEGPLLDEGFAGGAEPPAAVRASARRIPWLLLAALLLAGALSLLLVYGVR